jgi:hypothetical protein
MARRRIGPLLSLVLLVVLGGLVAYLEYRGDGKDAGADRDRPIPFQRSDLRSIALRGEHGSIRLEKSGDAWRLTGPLSADADPDAVESLLSSLETARVERRLGEEADRAPYGLDAPRAAITVETSSGAASTLELGAPSPVGGGHYALLPGGREVAVVSASTGDFAGKDVLNLRDKRLLQFDPWKVKRLRIERGRETVLLERPEPGWRLLQPIEAPADGPTVTDLLGAVENLRARNFVAETASAADLRRFGLSPPAARLTILQEGWDVEKTVVFGGKAPGDLRYARTEGKDPVVTVPEDAWPKIATRVFDLRRKEVLDLSQYRIAAITAAVDGGPALVISRKAEGAWAVSGAATGEAPSSAVDEVLRYVADLKAGAFIDRPPATQIAALARRPALDLTLQEEAGADGAAGRTQHIVAGRPGPGGLVPLRDMAWRAVALVPESTLVSLRNALDAVRAAASAAPPAGPPAADPKGAGDASSGS